MNFSSAFIHRPIATTLLAIGIAIAGIIAFNILAVAPLPQVEFPTISVQAALPGASPEVMSTSVASPLERQLGRIAGITQMTSTSTLGATRIIVQFDLSRNIDGAARDVQASINAARSQLPSNLPNNPTYRKINPADAPIMIISLTSETFSTGEMYDAASSILQQKLSQVEGVGQVFVGGSSLPAVRIELNPLALNSYGISLQQVQQTIAAQNVNRPQGQLIEGSKSFEIHVNDQLFKAYQYRELIIAYRNNNPVRLSDVAEVTDSIEDVRNAGLSDGKPAVVLVIFKQPGANVIKTIAHVEKVLPLLKASIPQSMHMTIVMDRSSTIKASLHDVELTLVIAMLLVVLVAYVFLGEKRAMLIPGVAVPLSLLGTFGVMYLLGFSLNNLSLMALTIATGFVVDDAVVVLENISRYLEKGESPLMAALKGAKEVGFTVLSMSLSLIAVFIPILLMGGIVGRLFREFSVTLAIAIIISLIISLTVTPMMCSQLLTQHRLQTGHTIKWLEGARNGYAKSLRWVLEHALLMLIITFATLALNIYLFIIIPKGFFPQQDTGRIISSIQGDQNISFQSMKNKLAEYVSIIVQDPAVLHVVGFVGGNNNTSNSGTLYLSLKPLSERGISADGVVNRLRAKIKEVAGARLYMQAAQDLVIGGRQGSAQFQYTLSTDNLKDLNKWIPYITEQVTKLPGIADVNSDLLNQGLQMHVDIDKNTASRVGVTTDQIDSTLYSAFGQSQISTMYTAMNQYHVVMEAAPQYWQDPKILTQMYVTSTAGTQVPLSLFAKFSASSTLLSVNHQGQSPAATLSFNLLPGIALGEAVKWINDKVGSMHLPASLHGSFQGTAQAFEESLANEFGLILAALLTVYIVLGILYESLVHPITILSTLPSAGVGALLALLITGTELSIIAVIGIILLIGIVKKNAIMMIDFALQVERTENKSSREAIFEAALLRFRPIMMTTTAALFGAFPLVFGFGLGAELRRPLGIAIVGGLLLSQVLTLYSTPVIYLYLDKVNNWRFRRIRTECVDIL